MANRARLESLERRRLLHATAVIEWNYLQVWADGGGGLLTVEATPTGARVTSTVAGDTRTKQLVGAYQRVTVRGSARRDVIRVTASEDKNFVWVAGYGGSDDINAQANAGATIRGSEGPDTIVGTRGPDQIDGHDGDDLINGEAGDDVIIGGAGHDTIVCGYGNDTADGGAGDDLITGGIESEDIMGAADAYTDTVRFDSATTGVTVRLGTGMNADGTGGTDYISRQVENVIATPFDDYLLGSSAHNGIWGMAGNDTALGAAGNDTCYGGSGADRLYGGADNDNLIGGAGLDFFDGGAGTDRATVDMLELAINVESTTVTGGLLLDPSLFP